MNFSSCRIIYYYIDFTQCLSVECLSRVVFASGVSFTKLSIYMRLLPVCVGMPIVIHRFLRMSLFASVFVGMSNSACRGFCKDALFSNSLRAG